MKTDKRTMIKHAITFLLTLFFLASCSKEETTSYTINGKVGNEPCWIVVFGLNNSFEKVDSI